ncbi:hypothetical protein H6G54_02640 [Anabaena cylindrica FACHB-243]|uniref:Helix-turn-helix domain-containing protein n=1 Tax=Anabaena cylindrica (strain ATCC 27899 / PCC 7122) TaxID=272123 RepID=K9ZSE9_ANACC|nr:MULTISPECIES: hypothetical protein [Anabaena]AFZ61285.1 hypothetical protein Anacy_6007 [Anabaena cylindrica PCC 7122]AZL96590.1 hypothetical protein [Anabaena sp. CCAP 1446/1C]MBD2416624.1 hypothetical protein [Anabaena cylindrica FACHB-243]MBY5284491.1 hypothetical protein [Anabaena sp. CCAP 1446/1C]MBY5306762.1 hypothetical protein [Anabaena sp. CCAP 1446/1C]
MKISSFYPVTPKVAKKLRQGKLTAAEWRIWSYLIEVDPWGDAYKDIDTLTVMTECDVSKATYYRAIAKFQELELFDIQDKGISIRNLSGVSSLKNETTVSEMRQDSQNCETRRRNETKKSKMRQDSQNCENQTPEPAPSKASEVPHTIQTYSDLKDTTEAENCCVLNKFEERLKIYGIHLYIFDEKSKIKNLAGFGISPNPKMATIQKILKGMPAEKAERAIAAFLAWLPNAKNVRCKYAAFASSLRENWEV